MENIEMWQCPETKKRWGGVGAVGRSYKRKGNTVLKAAELVAAFGDWGNIDGEEDLKMTIYFLVYDTWWTMLRLTRMGKEEKQVKVKETGTGWTGWRKKIGQLGTTLNLKFNKEAAEYMRSVSQDVFGIEIHVIKVWRKSQGWVRLPRVMYRMSKGPE